MKEEWVNELLPLAAKIAREFEYIPGLQKKTATIFDKSLLRNPKNRFPDAGKLLAAFR